MDKKLQTPPGMNAERTALTLAPVTFDGGFLIRQMARNLLYENEVDEPLYPLIERPASEQYSLIDSSSAIPRDAPDEVRQAYLDGLPAAEFRLASPKYDKFQPRLNAKGLIDDKALITDVLATVHPDFNWRSPADRHHLCWPRAEYVKVQTETASRAYSFREHGSNVIRVQRVFHNWIHAITLPPPMPDPDVMHFTLQAWEVVGDFFGAVRQTMNHQRLFAREEQRRGGYTEEQNEMVREILLRELGGVVLHLDKLQSIPEAYWPFRPDVSLQIAAGRVGQVLTKGCLNRTREVRLANVA